MKNPIIEKRLKEFINKYSDAPDLYWVPLVNLRINIPVVSFDLDEIYKNSDIVLLENVFKICHISDVNVFQMDHCEYFQHENIIELLYEKDDDGYNFPWYVETFYFDSSEKWLVYVSHEGTFSFTGRKITEVAAQCIDKVYIC